MDSDKSILLKSQALAGFLDIKFSGKLDSVYKNKENLEEGLAKMAKSKSIYKNEVDSFVDFYISNKNILKFAPQIEYVKDNFRYEENKSQLEYIARLSDKFKEAKENVIFRLNYKFYSGVQNFEEVDNLVKKYKKLKTIDGFQLWYFEKYIKNPRSFSFDENEPGLYELSDKTYENYDSEHDFYRLRIHELAKMVSEKSLKNRLLEKISFWRQK